jgi:hypothetical protein
MMYTATLRCWDQVSGSVGVRSCRSDSFSGQLCVRDHRNDSQAGEAAEKKQEAQLLVVVASHIPAEQSRTPGFEFALG